MYDVLLMILTWDSTKYALVQYLDYINTSYFVIEYIEP